MSIKKGSFIWRVAVIIPFVLTTFGCATRRYVRNKIEPVDQHIGAVETQTNDKIASLSSKHDGDISQVNERISTTDLKLSQTAALAQQAQGTAARAMDQTDTNTSTINANSSSIKANSAAMSTLNSSIAAAITFQLVDKADVLFALNSSTLTKDSKATLDEVARKVQTLPRAIVELAGFADVTGPMNNNVALSHRRAQAVQRYLALQNVPVRSIQIIGLGEDTPPSGLESEVSAPQGASTAEVNRLARRVGIRVLGAGSFEGSAARSQ